MADVEMDIASTRMNNGNEHVKQDLESQEKSGNEDSGEMSEEEEEEEAEANGAKTEDGPKHHSSSGGKHKRKKHKHRSKHKKHKHASDEDKDRKRKHRHKHRKHKRKEAGSPSGAALFAPSSHKKVESSPSSGNPSLDDRALLEDLEKRRAMIKAELDSQLMEGKVQSGMGLILQGYNSGSEEDGDGRIRNGEQRQRVSSGKPISPRGGKGGKSRRDSTEGSKSTSKRRSRSKSAERLGPAKESKPDKVTKTTKDTAVKDKSRGRSRSKDRKHSDGADRSKERAGKSNSPAAWRGEQKGGRADKRSSPQREDRPNQERARRRSRSPGRERPGRSDADRDKRPAKSPSKDASSGKENRSPHRRVPHSPEAHSARGGARQRSVPREQSPSGRSAQDEPLAFETAIAVATKTLPLFPPQTEQVSLGTQVMAQLPLVSAHSGGCFCELFGERDRYGRLRQYRRSMSRDRGRRTRRSRDEDKFKGSLSEGMKVDKESSGEEVLEDFDGEEVDEEFVIEQRRQQRLAIVQKYKVASDDTNMVSEPSSPQSSTRSRSPSPDDVLERVAADVKEYERENLDTFEASIKAKQNLIAQEKDGKALVRTVGPVGRHGQLNEHHSQVTYGVNEPLIEPKQ
ncbi:Serine/threonine-protein kinase PRP4 [Liparis tanakae]|uniref:Serine/threonine-protein kinase PRP4 n=1 Tax=Liparis tanakae TaxID=230148 RepID=A0A4Z2FU76_9TELE|nr:Serine/threonine-protein kinase PRP4 [Liparis tanakae]